jgi:prephenate dehydratase
MRLGYLGPPGTFSEQALLAALGGAGADAQRVPLPTIHETIMAAQKGEVDAVLVPIENSVEGAVNVTLDAMATDAPDLRVAGEHVLAIELALIGVAAVDLSDIGVVRSHPHATAQCAGFLRRELPRARILAAASTAEAVRDVGEGEAAIGTRFAAEIYGRVVLRDGVQDEHEHETRFVWLAREATVVPRPPGEAANPTTTKTSVLFAGAGDDAPGWLVRCLSEFAFRGVNLTKIESRPLRRRLGHYRFLVDAEGAQEDAPVAEAVAALRRHCEEVRVLGSYPAHRR